METTPDVFTADYTGQPGERTFFLQARSGAGTWTYQLEKQQVAVLAEKIREVLLMIDASDTVASAVPQRDPALGLEAPIEPEWRIGTIGLSFEEDTDSIVVALDPVSEGEEEPGPDEVLDFAVRLLVPRPQARAFVLHSLAVVAEGRPQCQLCGLPMDPDGHICPASNGHRLRD